MDRPTCIIIHQYSICCSVSHSTLTVAGTGQLYAVTCGSLYAEELSGECTIILHTNSSTTQQVTIRTLEGDTILDVTAAQVSES